MRYFLILLVALGCTSTNEKFAAYGGQVTADDAITINDFLSEVSDEESSYKVRGIIEEVCQMKGCWMTLRNSEGANIRVTFKDYGFFVPKDISGREVIIEGVANKEILEEDIARHYAEDGGKEYNESMRNSITFVANGVLVKES